MAWHQLLGHMCCHHFLPPHTKRLTALHNSPTVSSVLPLQTPTPQTSFFVYTLVTLHLGQVKYCRWIGEPIQNSNSPLHLSLSLSIYICLPYPLFCTTPNSRPLSICNLLFSVGVCELMLWSFAYLCLERFCCVYYLSYLELSAF
jgi:hypothetical protein